MKRIFAVFMVLAISAGLAVAQDALGLTGSLEFGFGNVAGEDYKLAGDGGEGWIKPKIAYNSGKTFGDFNLKAFLADKIALATNGGMVLSVGLMPQYTLNFSRASRLAIYANVDTFDFLIPSEGNGSWKAALKPGVKFTQTLEFGDLYADLNLPIGLVQKRDDPSIKLDLTLGAKTTMGVYGYISPLFLFADGSSNDVKPENVFKDLALRVGYAKDAIDGRVTVSIPMGKDKVKSSGMKITPRFQYGLLDNYALKLWLEADLGHIGADKDIAFSPALGVSYSF
jgi:hypothetical protein